jgi:hypothetical protein
MVAGVAAYQWRRQRPPAAAGPAIASEDDARLNADMERYDV